MSETDQLRKIFNENWISVFNTILGKDVTLSIESVKSVDNADVLMNIEKFTQHIRIDFTEGENGFIVMSQNNRLVSIISNLMIGLDTFSEEVSDDDKDAFAEAINQLFSSCQVPILDTMGVDVKFRNIRFIDNSEAIDMVHEHKMNLWNVSVEFDGISKETFTMLVPSPFGEPQEEQEAPSDRVDIPVDTQQSRPYNKNEYAYAGNGNINLLMDVELPVTIRIGSTEMKLIDIMRLGLGSIIELEKLVDDPVEVLVNNTLVARGEVVVYDSNFAIRITHVESRADRIRSLG